MFKLIQNLLPHGNAWNLYPVHKNFFKIFDAFETVLVQEYNEKIDQIFLDLIPAFSTKLAEWASSFNILITSSTSKTDLINSLEAEWARNKSITAADLQATLRQAGFSVYVHDVGSKSLDPRTLVGGQQTFAQWGDPDLVWGSNNAYWGRMKITEPSQVLVNKTGQGLDYVVPDNSDYWPFFVYIGGETFPNRITLDIDRKNEFERLVLKHKAAYVWAALLIDWE